MKRTFKNLIFITAFFSALILSSCHDSLFESINAEVKLDSNGINGDINSFARHGENIYLTNGSIYYKSNEGSTKTGAWNKQWVKLSSAPSISSYYDPTDTSADIPGSISSIASDGTYLYALVIVWHESNSGYNEGYTRRLFCTTADGSEITESSWTEIDATSITGTFENSSSGYVKNIFDNKYVSVSYDSEGKPSFDLTLRNAYARIYCKADSAYHVYKLNGTSVPTLVADGTNGSDAYTASAVYYKGSDYFSPYYALSANDKYIYYSKTRTVKDGSTVEAHSEIYYADGWDSTNGFTLGGTETSVAFNDGSVLSISVTKNYLLLGTSSGLKRTALTEGVPSASKTAFSTGYNTNNGDSIISCYVFKTFVLDPARNEGDNTSTGTDEYACSTIYGTISSSSDSFPETGLYSYYPSRGTWNRDGTADDSSKGN